MMKFFRKHNKKLLAVFMSLLMIVFVGGSALNSLLAPQGDRAVAESALGSITYSDQIRAQNTTQILARLGQNWQRPLGVGNIPLTETDWILLVREARQLGILPPVASLTHRMGDPAIANLVDIIAHQMRIKSERVLEALAEMEAVREAGLAIASTSIVSEAEIRTTARNALDKVRIKVAVLPASAFVDHGETLSEGEIDAHFRAHAEKESGEGLDFGYFVPPAVRVRYIRIDRKAIEDRIAVADLERKARAYYEEHRGSELAFRKSPDELIAAMSDPEDFVGPPTPSEYMAPVVPYVDFEAARDTAIRRVQAQHADEAAGVIAGWVLRYSGEAWAGAKRGEQRYKIAPAKCAEPAYYERVAERIPANVAYAEAVSTVTTELFTADQASELAGIGSASFSPKRGRAITLADLAFLTEGLIPQIPIGENVKSSEYLATYQTCQYPLRDADGNVYVFSVVGSREAHKPDSLDEVRESVIDDIRLQKGYEAALASAEVLQVNGTSIGLKQAFDADDELVGLAKTDDESDDVSDETTGVGYFSPAAFPRVQRYAAAYGRSAGGVYVPGGLGDLRSLPNDVVDQCFALEEADEKVAMLELKEKATVLVVEWTATQRGREDEFEGMRDQLVQQMTQARSREVLTDWLDPQKIRDRNGFTPVDR